MSSKVFKVLLIEGDTNETSLVKRYLGEGAAAPDRFDVTESVRVSSACHALAREDFDAIILDLQVPQNVGLEGFNRIRAQRPELPVILLTDLKDESLAIQALKRGAQDYLVKGTMDCCLLKRAIRYAVERKKLASLVESVLDKEESAKLIVDADAVVLYVNRAAEALFGVARAELAGKPFAYPREAGAVTIVSPKAAELSAEMSVSAIEWNGEPARLISFSGPGTAAEPQAAEHRRLEEIKNRFTRRLSHEMRNTLSTVKTAVFCLKDPPTGQLSTRQARLVDMISRNVDRQIRIFEKLNDLSRFRGGKLALDLKRLEVPALLDEITRESEFKGGPHRLIVEPAAGLPPIAGDADLLLQVLRSLLDNAFRFAQDRVTLSAARDDAGVRVTVADDGEGISKERLAGLFTPFAQLDRRPDAEAFQGGLGLTISREIVAAHGGRIWAESGASGSRFSFTLPAYSPSDREHAPNKIFVSNSRKRPTYAAAGGIQKERAS
jgi:two-component system phosphate regulon sensor histidine kinase PhoR